MVDLGLEARVVEAGFEDILVDDQAVVGRGHGQDDEEALGAGGRLETVLQAIERLGLGLDRGVIGIVFDNFRLLLVPGALSHDGSGVDYLPFFLVATQIPPVAGALVGKPSLVELFTRFVRDSPFDNGATLGNAY